MKQKEEIILFGYGKIGKILYPRIKNEYDIIGWVDNNPDVWGESYSGGVISPPDIISGFDGKIVIATSHLVSLEIISQVKGLGISDHQIYRGTSNLTEPILPFSACDIPDSNKEIIEYDQCHEAIISDSESNILIMCSFHTPYVIQLVKNTKKRHKWLNISLLTKSNEYLTELSGFVSHIYIYDTYSDLVNILRKGSKYKALHMLWMESAWVYVADCIRECTERCILNVGGSDFYRSSDTTRKYLHRLMIIADTINVQSINVKNDFLKVFPEFSLNTVVNNYGLEVIDYIPEPKDREIPKIMEDFALPTDRIIITCGHNAGEAHQHRDIIKALSQLEDRIKEQICAVFPMTYPTGKDAYVSEINSYLNQSGLSYQIITEYMDTYRMAEYAQVSDIMIHVQTTDQLSSTMLEEMYAGAIVIAGSWLPYQWLRDRGLYFISIDSIEEVTDVVKSIVEDFDEYKMRCQNNRSIIYDIGSWDVCGKKWVDLWMT